MKQRQPKKNVSSFKQPRKRKPTTKKIQQIDQRRNKKDQINVYSSKKVRKKKKPVKTGKSIKRKKRVRTTFFELLASIAIVGFCLWILSFFFFTIAKVEGYSMIPTLRSGEWVYVNKKKKIENFTLVYMNNPISGNKEVRRVIGLPGQSISYKNDRLTIDHEEKQEKFIFDERTRTNNNGQVFTSDFSVFTLTEKQTIPAGCYLVLGDNRLYATDSRVYGLVDKKEIIGVVTMRVLPLHKIEVF